MSRQKVRLGCVDTSTYNRIYEAVWEAFEKGKGIAAQGERVREKCETMPEGAPI
jgi:hypothetical protein